jgi:hypothetical protein
MAILNKTTWKQKFQDFIDRISPFDGNPLIQKAEHQELVGDDLGDSSIFREPITSAINSPSASFGVDFDNADRFDIDSTGSGGNSFDITLSNLKDNETGILNIIKKSGDLFTFANGLITPFNNTEGQDGQTSIVMFVKVVSGSYIVQIGYNYIVNTANIKDSAVTTAKIANDAVTSAKIATNAVGSSEIVANAVGNSEIADDSIDHDQIQDRELFRGNCSLGIPFQGLNTSRADSIGSAIEGNGVWCLDGRALDDFPVSSPRGILIQAREIVDASTLDDYISQAFIGNYSGKTRTFSRYSANGGSTWSSWEGSIE